ncbi:hypothetical protein [Streptomyces sp. NPDC008141]|uniref:hypothetical protein n=1 Tax=Streptomyces sp. NPDC008141 TaxID=3364815 RepID=UPI0036E229EE
MGYATRSRRATVLLAGLLVLPLAGCSDEPDGAADKKAAARQAAEKRTPATQQPRPAATAPAPAPANVEKIGALTGCTPEVRIQAKELREGVCTTAQGSWTVTTFPEEKFKTIWLDSARMYGGTYLVGPRWAVGGKPELLDTLRTKLGGEVVRLRDAAPGSSPSS